MLPLTVVQEVRRLLDEDELSQRKIAFKLGISRGTVDAIASGRRGIYGREPDQKQSDLPCLELAPQRCSGCGAQVYMPCVLCRARRYRHRQRQLGQLQSIRQAGRVSRRVA